jgi:hypothetical protein
VPPLTAATNVTSSPSRPVRSKRSTRTIRAGASSTSPFLAASCSVRPPTFTAENAGGRCALAPSLAAIAASIASSVTSTDAVCVTTPSASSVSVSTPSRIASFVELGQVAEEPQQARRPADAHHEQARRHRIERARVTDLAGARASAARWRRRRAT